MMKKRSLKRLAALVLSFGLALGSAAVRLPGGPGITAFAEERSAIVNTNNLNVRTGPGTGYSSVAKLQKGVQVTVVSEQNASDGTRWYEVRYGGSSTGFVSANYIRFPSQTVSDGDFESQMANQGFPESYRNYLRELHAQFPNWSFKARKTGLDWTTAVDNESVVGRNLVERNNVSSWKSTAPGAYDWSTGTWPGFDGSAWVAASRGLIEYYMDPRNFLREGYIYQFLDQNYNASLQTREGLTALVSGTFLANPVKTGGNAAYRESGNDEAVSGVYRNDGTASGPALGLAAKKKYEAVFVTNIIIEPFPNNGQAGQTVPETQAQQTVPATQGQGPASGSLPGPVLSDILPPETAAAQAETGGSQNGNSSGSGVIVVPDGGSPGSQGNAGGMSGEPGSSVSGGQAVSGERTYVDIIMDAAAASGVSPYILAAMILQEQGNNGTSGSISGSVSGYNGIYNYFNVEAYQSGSMSAVQRGLWWASQSGSYGRPWDTPEKAIRGGAQFYGENYVKSGQDTLYLKKFNVQGSNLYKHQYMTNVLGAAAEGKRLASISALTREPLSFSIPVYENMPATPPLRPSTDGSPNNKLNGLSVDGFTLTPAFSMDVENYELVVDPSVTQVTVNASRIDSKASVSGAGYVNVAADGVIEIQVRAENGDIRSYRIQVVHRDGGASYNGSVSSQSSSGQTSSGQAYGPAASGPAAGGGTASSGSSSGQSSTTIVTIVPAQ